MARQEVDIHLLDGVLREKIPKQSCRFYSRRFIGLQMTLSVAVYPLHGWQNRMYYELSTQLSGLSIHRILPRKSSNGL